jgi:hypothetical protein
MHLSSLKVLSVFPCIASSCAANIPPTLYLKAPLVLEQASLILRNAKNSCGYLKVKSTMASKLKRLRNSGARIANQRIGKKLTPFQKSHALKFALEVVSTEGSGNVTVRCKFCLHEGRDVVEVSVAGRKRKQRWDIKYFTKPFAPFTYRSHHEGQQKSSWTEYQGLSAEQKLQYFEGVSISATRSITTSIWIPTRCSTS